MNVEDALLDAALSELLADGRIAKSDDGQAYSSARLIVTRDGKRGREASVYDHFQALVSTICARLEDDADQSEYAPFVGGCTYTFDVGRDHPMREEVLAILSDLRLAGARGRAQSTRG